MNAANAEKLRIFATPLSMYFDPQFALAETRSPILGENRVCYYKFLMRHYLTSHTGENEDRS